MPNQLSTSKTAVLLFNSTSKQQASIMQLAPNMPAKKVSGLLEVLNSRVRSLVKKTKLPLFQVEIGKHSDFGSQTHEAYQKLFDLGFESVVGITNDCPALTIEDILLAATSLKSQQVVLGPAKDGGLYLFGLRKNQLSKQDFTQLNWQSKSLINGVKEICITKSVVVLATKADMDTAADIIAVFHLKFEFLSDFFKQIFSFTQRIVRELTEVRIQLFFKSLSLRAPPMLLIAR
ncbi:MAG: glycosyltransferase A (GT-A) superfamily protein (DUF2064 family) [Vicingaceae bacterium]